MRRVRAQRVHSRVRPQESRRSLWLLVAAAGAGWRRGSLARSLLYQCPSRPEAERWHPLDPPCSLCRARLGTADWSRLSLSYPSYEALTLRLRSVCLSPSPSLPLPVMRLVLIPAYLFPRQHAISIGMVGSRVFPPPESACSENTGGELKPPLCRGAVVFVLL